MVVPSSVFDGVAVRLFAILTYDGSTLDTMLNFTALYMTVMAMAERARASTVPGSRRYWPHFLLFLWLYQIGLCFATGYDGISVVWNAALAWAVCVRWREARRPGQAQQQPGFHDAKSADLAVDRRELPGVVPLPPDVVLDDEGLALRLALVVGLAVNLYYVFAEAPITTVAHVASWVLGALIYFVDRHIVKSAA